MVLAIIIMAAAAAETAAVQGCGGSGWISGDTLTTLISILAGAGGVVGGKMWGERSAKKVKADIPQPCLTEQTGYQAAMKANEHDHENLFNRVAKLESRVEGISAKIDAKFEAITEQLRETKDMVSKLFERICKGKK